MSYVTTIKKLKYEYYLGYSKQIERNYPNENFIFHLHHEKDECGLISYLLNQTSRSTLQGASYRWMIL